jgi:hypothetical protein
MNAGTSSKGMAEWCLRLIFPRVGRMSFRWPFQRAGLARSGSRLPITTAASSTRSSRPRTRSAVSGRRDQIGVRQAFTSSVLIDPTGMSQIGLQYIFSDERHCALCLSFFQPASSPSITSVATSPKVSPVRTGAGAAAAWRAEMGSSPRLTATRASAALSRASASETSESPPRPISRRFPALWKMNIHRLPPSFPTRR